MPSDFDDEYIALWKSGKPPPDVFAFLSHGDLFIFSSMTETQGLVLLESMAVGTPVVAIAGIGVSDLLESETGGIETGPSLKEFTGAVHRMLSDSDLREQKSRESINRARAWSVENQVSKLVSIYADSIADFEKHGLPRFHRRQRY